MAEMYYELDIPGVYLKTDFAESQVRIAVLQEDSADTGGAPLYVVWDSLWEFPGKVDHETVDLTGTDGLRVHNLLVIEEELYVGVTILSQPPGKEERRLHVYPMGDFYGRVLNYTKDNDAFQNPKLRYRMIPWQLFTPMVEAPEEDETEEAEEADEAEEVEEAKGKTARVPQSSIADENVAESSEEENDEIQTTKVCVRRHGTKSYYLIIKEGKLFLVPFDHAPDWDRMLEEKPKVSGKPFRFGNQCKSYQIPCLQTSLKVSKASVEVSQFPKGYAIHMVNCGLKSKKKEANTAVGDPKREAVDDNTFYLLHPATNTLTHRDYKMFTNRQGNTVVEGKNYPQWHAGIAQHNANVLEKFLDELKALVTNAAGSWTDNRHWSRHRRH